MILPGNRIAGPSGLSGLLALLALLAALFGCAATGPVAGPTAACYAIYDAGSSGTRLHIFQLTAHRWVEHAGPTAGPLADPARRNRGKTMQDAENVTSAIAALLEAIRHPGPADRGGQPKWPAFDWRQRCDLKLLAVYATGGMRLAERDHADDAAALWAMLRSKLSARTTAPVEARTLSGFEEGVYAWLAVRTTRKDDRFGTVDMGGVSAQVTFPCAGCNGSVNVRVGRRNVPLFSASFPGLGQDEAWKEFGSRPACKLAAAGHDPAWRAQKCTRGIVLTDGKRNLAEIPVGRSSARRWYLGGALRYVRPGDVQRYCGAGRKSDYEPERACFRTLYALYFLQTLGIPADAARFDDDWTLGAAVCSADDCLAAAN